MSDAERATIGVVGAGTMGAGIAQVAATAGHAVLLFDVDPHGLARATAAVGGFLERAVAKGTLEGTERDAIQARLSTTTDLAALAAAGVVIEAVPERLDLKRDLFAQLEAIVAPEAVLATNTSTLSVAAIAAGLARPERACGMHFFNPAPLMALVEVVRGPATGEGTLARVVALARAWSKEPVVVGDTPGFIVNRVARPFYGEALRLVGDGHADVATVDRLARDAGFAMGPFELMDLIGIDVNLAAATSVWEGFFHEPRFRPHPLQRAMVESGRLGRKTGRGYYEHPSG